MVSSDTLFFFGLLTFYAFSQDFIVVILLRFFSVLLRDEKKARS
jgi:hypothetical protein